MFAFSIRRGGGVKPSSCEWMDLVCEVLLFEGLHNNVWHAGKVSDHEVSE